MKKLIKKILKEDIDPDWDWVHDIELDEVFKNFDWMEVAAEVFTGKGEDYDEETDENYLFDLDEKQIEEKTLQLEYYLAKFHFHDIEVRNDKFYLTVGSWYDFADLFEECDGGYNYICRHTAQSILSEDYNWEPYYDLVNDWRNDVWDLVSDESVTIVINFIRENHLGETIEYEGGELEITEELLNRLSTNSDELGKIIDDSPEFSEMKNNLAWGYDDAYNSCSYDNIWSSAHEAITDLFGESEWENYQGTRNGEPVTRQHLVFDITDIFFEVIEVYFTQYCDMEYDRSCDFEYSGFLDNVQMLMHEELWNEELNPRFDEWPDHNDLRERFNESVYDRLHW